MDSRTRQIRKHIASRVAYARDQRDETQTDLARQLTDYSSEHWSRGMVANLETGKKAITIEDLCAIAFVQDKTVTWYFEDVPATLRDVIPGWLSLLMVGGRGKTAPPTGLSALAS